MERSFRFLSRMLLYHGLVHADRALLRSSHTHFTTDYVNSLFVDEQSPTLYTRTHPWTVFLALLRVRHVHIVVVTVIFVGAFLLCGLNVIRYLIHAAWPSTSGRTSRRREACIKVHHWSIANSNASLGSEQTKRDATLELAMRCTVLTRELEQLCNSRHRAPETGQDASHAEYCALLAYAQPALQVSKQVVLENVAASQRGLSRLVTQPT